MEILNQSRLKLQGYPLRFPASLSHGVFELAIKSKYYTYLIRVAEPYVHCDLIKEVDPLIIKLSKVPFSDQIKVTRSYRKPKKALK
jgi:hypothetical protein